MLLGLPAHLAPQSMGRAVARSCHVIACVVLAAASVLVVVEQLSQPGAILWPALVALVPMLGLLVVVERFGTPTATLAYLLVGAACLYWYAVTFFVQADLVESTDALLLTLPKVALIMVGGSGMVPRLSLVWTGLGFALGELATQLAAWQTGYDIRLDVTGLLSFAVVFCTVGWGIVARDRVRRAQPSLHRAARDEELRSVRHDIELQAAAHLHDTVLSHLAALSTGGAGRLRPQLAAAMRDDLETLVGQEWLDADPTQPASGRRGSLVGTGVGDGPDPWLESDLYRAVAEGRERGLEIGVTGDVSQVAELDASRGRALGLAVGQCLVNVQNHSGTDRAELVIYGEPGELTVMVIDDGRGFDTTATGGDRLGLKNSVHLRMQRAGGSAQVWSSPGSGTSVMIRVPTTPHLLIERGGAA
ncbi:sensor histidine kinase [Frigoribacterium sp. 2-23]|uniref:sensor histidine kinase n=1 Tax=Frigoribacterium sp. 2-23 TaxID=3415006 RepID=UPI003C6F0A24